MPSTLTPLSATGRPDAERRPLHHLFCILVLLAVQLACTAVRAADAQAAGKPFKIEPARRHMLRMGYTYIKPSDRPANTVDLTGPIVPYGTTVPSSPNYLDWSSVGGAPLALQVLDGFGTPASHLGIPADHPDNPEAYALGTPTGATTSAAGAGTPTISILSFLDDDRMWAIEGYVLGIPPKVQIKGAGRIGGDTQTYPGMTIAPFSAAGGAVDLGTVATTRQLPITFVLHRFLGPSTWRFRPSLGLGVSYAIFFNSDATKSLEDYAGGPTKVKIKNAFGIGPFAGFSYAVDERWTLNATIGYIKMKTKATMTTRVDPNILGVSPGQAQAALDVGPNTLQSILTGQNSTINGVPGTVDALRKLAVLRTGDPNYLGTYSRRADARLDPVVLTISVGYDF